MPEPISTPEELHALSERLESVEEVGFDTEFHGERSYWPKLMLVQIGTADEVALIDPRAPEMEDAVAVFLRSLCRRDRLIVGHDVRADLEILQRVGGRLPARVFDTQIAASFLGMGHHIGLGKLVDNLMGVELPKGHTLADWSRRPLPAEQLEYAANDVRHLPRLTKMLQQEIHERGRTSWVEEECARLLEHADHDQADPAVHLKGVRRSPPEGTRAALLVKRLAAAREDLARELDRRPRHILPDDVLVDLAKRAPTRRSELVGNTSRRRPPGLTRHGDVWLKTIRQGMDSPLPARTTPRPRPGGGHQDFLALVRLFVAFRVRQLDLANALVMGRMKEGIERVVDELPPDRETFDKVMGLGGWRREVFSDDLWALYCGEMQPEVRQGPDGPLVTWQKTPRH
jgi:ribonuclease D